MKGIFRPIYRGLMRKRESREIQMFRKVNFFSLERHSLVASTIFFIHGSFQMSTNAKMTVMVATGMPLVTILKVPTTVSANQDFMEEEKTAAKVSQHNDTFENPQCN